MLTDAELRAVGILPWNEWAGEFKEADLLLGNGFSQNIHADFSYRSLFEEFLKNLDPADAAVMRGFTTHNFETILARLKIALDVAHLLGIETVPIERTTTLVRDGLISAVRANHPSYAAIDEDHLNAVCIALDAFQDVYTLSYDALLYHVIMLTLDRVKSGAPGVRRYNDYFWGEHPEPGFKLWTGYQNYPHDELFYLHGALFIFRNENDETVKIVRNGGRDLLDSIDAQIRSGSAPLFVSEGAAADKEAAIARSQYLSFVNNRLRTCRPLVVYGVAFNDEDRHVVRSLKARRESIVCSIYVNDRTQQDLETEMASVRALLGPQLRGFFDSRTLFHK